MSALDEVRFWQQVSKDAERTVICSPELESRCIGYVSAAGLEHRITVQAHPYAPKDRIFVVDYRAAEAMMNQALQRPARFR